MKNELNLTAIQSMLLSAVIDEIGLVIHKKDEAGQITEVFVNKHFYVPAPPGGGLENVSYGEYYDSLVKEFEKKETLAELLGWAQWVLSFWTPKMREDIQNYKESSKRDEKK